MLHEPPPPDEPPLRQKSLTYDESASQSGSFLQMIDILLSALSKKSTPETPRMQLFFVLGAVQTMSMWILQDFRFVQYLIIKAVYNRLPYKLLIRDPGDVRVFGGNGEALDLKGFAVLFVFLGSTLFWHEFKVVLNLPLEVLIGADIMAPYLCLLLYLKNNRKRHLEFKYSLAAVNIAATPRSALKCK